MWLDSPGNIFLRTFTKFFQATSNIHSPVSFDSSIVPTQTVDASQPDAGCGDFNLPSHFFVESKFFSLWSEQNIMAAEGQSLTVGKDYIGAIYKCLFCIHDEYYMLDADGKTAATAIADLVSWGSAYTITT